jgi:hypothetical protein
MHAWACCTARATPTLDDDDSIEMDPIAGYGPQANRLAECHNLTSLDLALPMLAYTIDRRLGLPLLGPEHAGDSVLSTNYLHNAPPAKGALVGCTPRASFHHRKVSLSVFRRLVGRVHSTGRQHKHWHKSKPREGLIAFLASRSRLA